MPYLKHYIVLMPNCNFSLSLAMCPIKVQTTHYTQLYATSLHFPWNEELQSVESRRLAWKGFVYTGAKCGLVPTCLSPQLSRNWNSWVFKIFQALHIRGGGNPGQQWAERQVQICILLWYRQAHSCLHAVSILQKGFKCMLGLLGFHNSTGLQHSATLEKLVHFLITVFLIDY